MYKRQGLFYAPTSLDAMDGLFADVRRDDYLAAQDALMESGYEAEVFGRPVAELCDRIVKIARDGLAEDVYKRQSLRPSGGCPSRTS